MPTSQSSDFVSTRAWLVVASLCLVMLGLGMTLYAVWPRKYGQTPVADLAHTHRGRLDRSLRTRERRHRRSR
jgi:hypothetical protein